MRRGFDQPTSSSLSRASGTREPAQRTRQGRNDALTQSEPIVTRSSPSNPPVLKLPQPDIGLPPAPSGRKSPAYLEGKNPYGQILDSIDHSYRRPKVELEPSSQVGAISEGIPRTAGFKTFPEVGAEPVRVNVPDALPLPLLSSRTPAKPVSVRAAKEFFESKSSQSRSAPLFPPTGTAAAAKVVNAKKPVVGVQPPTLPSRCCNDEVAQPSRLPSPKPRVNIQAASGVKPSMPRPSRDVSPQFDSHQGTEPFARLRDDCTHPAVVLHKGTTRRESDGYDVLSPSGHSEPRSGKIRSTNVFETGPREADLLGCERRAVHDSSELHDGNNASHVILSETPPHM
ncbi:hypothetical protein C7974DRAFT_224138 [Boeremia exigua]|uniref:uncharacterized protein n=1 Tax=Boeremia exigua TaxID=749465 RepID=UPI001E8ED9EF|nr:uncharacterized protein C7974DRAFT_224138 [Boeremia exigua]KAH6619978.1 hypothetical protein C7974DRAFT_224138 [Boeremia exigua]